MTPPASAQVFETANNSHWYEGELLCIVTRKAPAIAFDEHRKRSEAFKSALNGKKICAVIDITNSSITSAENREYNQQVLPEIFKAIAFVSQTALGKMLVNLYLGMQPPPFPTKVFSNDKDAKAWIAQYL
ncbi:MAG: hypothetical protein JWO09_277 [Bacteroidetes bacterium]|nr:hypothetical protein [Bacteroidota bacterium]